MALKTWSEWQITEQFINHCAAGGFKLKYNDGSFGSTGWPMTSVSMQVHVHVYQQLAVVSKVYPCAKSCPI